MLVFSPSVIEHKIFSHFFYFSFFFGFALQPVKNFTRFLTLCNVLSNMYFSAKNAHLI